MSNKKKVTRQRVKMPDSKIFQTEGQSKFLTIINFLKLVKSLFFFALTTMTVGYV